MRELGAELAVVNSLVDEGAGLCAGFASIDELENLHADRTTVCFEP